MGKQVGELDAEQERQVAGTSEELGAEREKRRRPGAFTKGDPRINRSGRPPAARDEREGGPGRCGRPSRLLRDMRWVYENRADRSETDEALRARYRARPREFLVHLAKLEEASAKEAAARRGPARAAGPDELGEDEGTKGALELLEGWKKALEDGANGMPDTLVPEE